VIAMSFFTQSTDTRLLPEGRLAGPMPWIIGIMMFLMVLAATAGMSLARAATSLDSDLAGRVTVQVVEANSARRAAQVRALSDQLVRLGAVETVRRVPDAEIAKLLDPWFGEEGLDPDLPVPALIDVTLRRSSPDDLALIRSSVKATAPSARVDLHADWLAPLARLLGSLTWLSGMLVALMAVATASIVVLTARASLNTHQGTIEVMHLLGASDFQIAGLFQRRLGLDALIGGAVGLGFALLALALLGSRLSEIGSDLLGSVGLGWLGWTIIVLLPLLGAAVATFAARFTILTALRRIL
jgi:cell division transport system permease protein